MAPEHRLILETQALQTELLLHIADTLAMPESQRQQNELQEAIEAARNHQEKVRLVLTQTGHPPMPHQ